jgi:hypothetical protein
MAMSKAALLRAVTDDIPIALLDTIVSTYIPPSEIEAAVRLAITGEEGGDSTSFAGINRYVFVGAGDRAFIDPAGILMQETKTQIRELRRARGADPAGMKKRTRTMAQKQAAQISPAGAG